MRINQEIKSKIDKFDEFVYIQNNWNMSIIYYYDNKIWNDDNDMNKKNKKD